MEEKLELMNEAVELVGDTDLLEEVIEAAAKEPITVGKIIKKVGIPVAVVVVGGTIIYLGIKKFKKAKEDKMVHREETEVEVVETEE